MTEEEKILNAKKVYRRMLGESIVHFGPNGSLRLTEKSFDNNYYEVHVEPSDTNLIGVGDIGVDTQGEMWSVRSIDRTHSLFIIFSLYKM